MASAIREKLKEAAVKRSSIYENTFKRLDLDGDGFLTEAELRAESDSEGYLACKMMADENEDGKITFEEMWQDYVNDFLDLTENENKLAIKMSYLYMKVMAVFNKQCIDKKTYITLEEMEEKAKTSTDARRKEQLAVFRRLDVDKNKKLSGAEWFDAHLNVKFPDIPTELFLMETFAKRDINKDGTLSLDEINQAWVMGRKEYELGFDVKEVLAKSDGAKKGGEKDGKVDIEEFIRTWKEMLRDKKFPVKA